MPPEESWLSCEVSEKDARLVTQKSSLAPGFSLTGARQPRSAKPSIFISIPKKVIPLATARNRIKRLIREAMRKNPYLNDPRKVYFFKVVKAPLRPSLAEVQSFIQKNRR